MNSRSLGNVTRPLYCMQLSYEVWPALACEEKAKLPFDSHGLILDRETKRSVAAVVVACALLSHGPDLVASAQHQQRVVQRFTLLVAPTPVGIDQSAMSVGVGQDAPI